MKQEIFTQIQRLKDQGKSLILSRSHQLPPRGEYLVVDTLGDNNFESEVEEYAREVMRRFNIERKDENNYGNYLLIKVKDPYA